MNDIICSRHQTSRQLGWEVPRRASLLLMWLNYIRRSSLLGVLLMYFGVVLFSELDRSPFSRATSWWPSSFNMTRFSSSPHSNTTITPSRHLLPISDPLHLVSFSCRICLISNLAEYCTTEIQSLNNFVPSTRSPLLQSIILPAILRPKGYRPFSTVDQM